RPRMRPAGFMIEDLTKITAVDQGAAHSTPVEMLRLRHLDRLAGLWIDPEASIYPALDHAYSPNLFRTPRATSCGARCRVRRLDRSSAPPTVESRASGRGAPGALSSTPRPCPRLPRQLGRIEPLIDSGGLGLVGVDLALVAPEPAFDLNP